MKTIDLIHKYYTELQKVFLINTIEYNDSKNVEDLLHEAIIKVIEDNTIDNKTDLFKYVSSYISSWSFRNRMKEYNNKPIEYASTIATEEHQ